jgi:hypothetical protein
MNRRLTRFVSAAGSCLGILMLLAGTPKAARAQTPDCALINMTVTASVSNDPGFVGLYKYTVVGQWDVGQRALSHLDIFLAFQECACKCDNRIFKFPTYAGTSNGVNGATSCTVNYLGSYVCKGDPSIPDALKAPTVKFDDNDGACQPLTVGSGSWVFYSPFPPGPFAVYPDAVAIKHGLQTCLGDLKGVLPICDCAVPTLPSTWGHIKSSYR